MPKDDVTGWNPRAAMPSLKSLPTPIVGAAAAVMVAMLAVVVYLGLRLDGMTVAQGTLDRRVAALEARPSADPASLASLVTATNLSSDRIAALEVAPRTDPDVLAALVTQVKTLSGRTDALESRPAGDPTSLGALASRIDASAARLAALEAAPRADPAVLAALGDRVTALEARPPVDPAAVGALATGLQDSARRVATLEATPRADPGAVTALGTQVTALSERTAALEARPPGDPAALDMLTAGLDAAVSRVAALEAKPSIDPAPIVALEDQVTALTGRLTVIETERTAATANATPSGAPAPHAEAGWVMLGQIQFDRGSFAPGAPERAEIAAIAKTAIETGRQLVLRGYADRVGNPVFNQALSLRRAIAVQQALIDADVPAAQFRSVDGYGEDALPIRTGDEKSEPGNRVVVVFGSTGASTERAAKN